MEFSELLDKRRSVRKYADKPVSTDLLKEMINDSLLAPSAGNEQSWKFIIVNDKDLMKRISDECKKNLVSFIKNNPENFAARYLNMLQDESFNIFYNAPSLVIILGESGIKNLLLDCTLAASYFMLSAASRGLGTCWINFAKYIKSPLLLQEVGIPEDHTIVAPVIVGYPEHMPAVPKRKEAVILKVSE